LLSKENSSEAALKKGIDWLIKWWSEFFTLSGPGLFTVPYNDLEGHYKGHKTLEEWIDSRESDENSDFIEDITAFMALLASKSGTRDTSAELFAALLRSCGCNTRLVCSLQPVPYRIPSTPSNSTKNNKHDEEPKSSKEDKKLLFQYRVNSRAYVDPNIQLKTPKAKPPTVWVEVYATDTKRWISIDPIRGYIDKPLMMEPANLDRSNSLSFVLAFDKKGQGTDVTRRYTSNMEKVIKLRERPLTKREMEGGMKLWSDILLQAVCHKSKTNEKDHAEQQELEQREVKEVMPTSISAFKNHPVYALERHLLKYEIIYPKDLVLGGIRGETIYPRSSVKTVSTAETFRKAGRQIKEGEQPMKTVKANAFTIEKKRLKELAKQEGEDYSVPCYGEWQTEPYVAPPVIDVSFRCTWIKKETYILAVFRAFYPRTRLEILNFSQHPCYLKVQHIYQVSE
jgi:xeroderma pigmentosum group C-complementing protein